MQGAIIPSSDAGILVLGWHRRALRKVNPNSWSSYDFCHKVFGLVSALTPTSLAEFVTSLHMQDTAGWNLNLGFGNECPHFSVFFFFSERCDERDCGLAVTMATVPWLDLKKLSGTKCMGRCHQILWLFSPLLPEQVTGGEWKEYRHRSQSWFLIVTCVSLDT